MPEQKIMSFVNIVCHYCPIKHFFNKSSYYKQNSNYLPYIKCTGLLYLVSKTVFYIMNN